MKIKQFKIMILLLSVSFITSSFCIVNNIKQHMFDDRTHLIVYDEYNNKKYSFSGISEVDKDGCIILNEALLQNIQNVY